MRTSSLITISLPPALVNQTEKVAKRRHMTRSELLRTALRHYLEEVQLEEAIQSATDDLVHGRTKILPRGGLAQLLRQ